MLSSALFSALTITETTLAGGQSIDDYQAMAAAHGKSLSIIAADLMTLKWPPQARWDVAWFDVWPNLCTDALDSMAALRRSYGRRAGWCECWGRGHLLDRRRQEKRMGW